MKVQYVARDGKVFDDRSECYKYEFINSDIIIISDNDEILDKSDILNSKDKYTVDAEYYHKNATTKIIQISQVILLTRYDWEIMHEIINIIPCDIFDTNSGLDVGINIYDPEESATCWRNCPMSAFKIIQETMNNLSSQ